MRRRGFLGMLAGVGAAPLVLSRAKAAPPVASATCAHLFGERLGHYCLECEREMARALERLIGPSRYAGQDNAAADPIFLRGGPDSPDLDAALDELLKGNGRPNVIVLHEDTAELIRVRHMARGRTRGERGRRSPTTARRPTRR